MSVESHDYIIIAIIAGIIILQVFVFAVNVGKIRDYKKTIRQAKNFEVIEVEVPEEWIKKIEVSEILNNPEAFRESSANFLNHTIAEASGDKTNGHADVIEEIENENENSTYEYGAAEFRQIDNGPNPEELTFHKEEFGTEAETEIEEYDEDDFEFEEDEYKINNKRKR